MSDPYLGEIRMFAGTFAPRGWALCQGQLLSISSYQALFSLLGTYYGGDGRTTFALPDLRGRFPMHASSGHPLGQKSGTETVTLSASELPPHSHSLRCNTERANATTPVNNVLATSASGDHQYVDPPSTTTNMYSNAVAASGGSQAHDNMSPFLCITFIIAVQGIYPSRT